MSNITKMSRAESVEAIEMVVRLATSGHRVVVSAETDGVGLDNIFRVSVIETDTDTEISTSSGHFRLIGALTDAFEMIPEEDDACSRHLQISRS